MSTWHRYRTQRTDGVLVSTFLAVNAWLRAPTTPISGQSPVLECVDESVLESARHGAAWHVCVFLVPHTMDEYLPPYLNSTVRRQVHVHVQV